MPRQPRLVLPGVAVHVVQRGNNRGPCFCNPRDYALYLQYLLELARKFACGLHAYCLMPNHVHLLMTPPSADACSALMRELGQRYVQYFNRRYNRSGTLWEGRYRSSPTDSARYVLACYRYIEMNPVRAGIVQRPQDYEWSSHRMNATGRCAGPLSTHPEFEASSPTQDGRRHAYLDLFETELDPALLSEIRKATNAGYPLGLAASGSEPGL